MYLKHYMLGVLGQVSSRARDPRDITVEEYLSFRRGTIGAMPCFCLVEYAEGIDLPQYIIDHPSIAACQQVAVDLVLIDNDVLSYRKDLVSTDSAKNPACTNLAVHRSKARSSTWSTFSASPEA